MMDPDAFAAPREGHTTPVADRAEQVSRILG